MKIHTRIGALEKAREKARISRNKLAELDGTSRQSYHQFFTKYKISKERMLRYAKLLDKNAEVKEVLIVNGKEYIIK